MKDKYGNKRKISFKYKCWLIVLPILFLAFFLILVFKYRIFDKFETTEIISINGVSDKDITFTSGKQEIKFLVDGEEYTVFYQQPIGSLQKYLKVGDKINI